MTTPWLSIRTQATLIQFIEDPRHSAVINWSGTQLLPSVGPVADPGVQAVSPHKSTWQLAANYLFPPGLRLSSQPQSITAPWLVTSYTAWWQRHIGMNNLPKVVTQLLPRVGFEPTTCWSQVQNSTRCATAPPVVNYDYMIKLYNVNKYSKYSIYPVCMLHHTSKVFQLLKS